MSKEELVKEISIFEQSLKKVIDKRIPWQLQDDNFRFVKIRKAGQDRYQKINGEFQLVGVYSGKEPYAKWPKNWRVDGNFAYDDKEFVKYLNDAHAYGIVCGYGGLVIIDFDDVPYMKKIMPELIKKYPTMTVKTGSGKFHMYYKCIGQTTRRIVWTDGEKVLVEMRGDGGQCLGPNSIHPSGKYYAVAGHDHPIKEVDFEDIKEIIDSLTPTVEKEVQQQVISKSYKNGKTVVEQDYERQLHGKGFRMKDALDILGVTYQHPDEGHCEDPRHDSTGGQCVHYTQFGWTCFNCRDTGNGQYSGNGFDFISYCKGIELAEVYKLVADHLDIEVSDPMGEDDGWQEKTWKVVRLHQKKLGVESDQETNIYREVAKIVYLLHPYFYDNNGLYWKWSRNRFCYEIVDDTDMMIAVDSEFPSMGTENSTIRNSLKESIKKYGRIKTPKDAPDDWIQFKDKIVDLGSGEEFDASYKFFVTNPIPWKLGVTEETPTIDNLFKDWVVGGNQDESYMLTLLETVAYTILPNYPLHRLFVLIGEGMNGKTSFVQLLQKFVGEENSTTTDLGTLVKSRFEACKLYRKLLCEVDEVDRYILKKTSLMKRLVGNGYIPIEFKNKTPFDFKNYAKMVMCTNKLPQTGDTTDGFFRRWCIIDFPNQFSERKEVIKDIPNVEFENLSRRCVGVLKRLLEEGTFTNEGSIEDRRKKYEERSSTISDFIRDMLDPDPSSKITSEILFRMYEDWAEDNHQKKVSNTRVGRELTTLGYPSERLTVGGNKITYRIGLKQKHQEEFVEDEPQIRSNGMKWI